MFDLIVSLVILAAIALAAGGFVLLRNGNRKQGLLMWLLAGVMVANVAIWLVPTKTGESLADVAAEAE